ncbi:hypothetical protein RGQ29_008430 [Quercus rubra]|uniref:Uncharacterized protein n=1 Tax=Quercus rubra TaxID=3512 RepID=A0AAN7E0B3_QUERU|nr:hypothetical protein RGQ29_008430 [Quercus rubra]
MLIRRNLPVIVAAPGAFKGGREVGRLWRFIIEKKWEGRTPSFLGIVVQSVRAPPCQGGSCGFEPRQSRPRIR